MLVKEKEQSDDNEGVKFQISVLLITFFLGCRGWYLETLYMFES